MRRSNETGVVQEKELVLVRPHALVAVVVRSVTAPRKEQRRAANNPAARD